MININDYVHKTVDFELNDKQIHVKLPSPNVMAELANVDKNIKDGDNVTVFQTRPKQAAVLMSFNTDGVDFTAEDMAQLPDQALVVIIESIISAKVAMDNDPNSKSQSRTGMSDLQ